jgi:hypothetical protein
MKDWLTEIWTMLISRADGPLTFRFVSDCCILIPFFALRTLGEVVGDHNLIRLFLEHRRRAANQ